MIDSFDIAEQLYDDAIGYLDSNYAYFVTNVLNAGKPRWDTSIPTAAVVVPKAEARTGQFEFIFNPTFASSLTMPQFAFVLAHECMHVILYHLSLSLNFDDKEIFNIAADCVINDYLVNAGLEPISGLCRGDDVVGFDTSNSTVTEVYNIIENNPDIQEQIGLGSDNQPQWVTIDSHDWMHDPSSINDFTQAMAQSGYTPNDLPDDLEEILNETINEYQKTQMAGKGSSSKDEFMKEQKVTLKWIELLERVDPDMFYEPGAGPKPLSSFRRTRRKLSAMSSFSDAILPSMETPDSGSLVRKSDRKPYIVLALDTSGSIGKDTANKFVNLARSIPQDKVAVKACTFTTSYRSLDIDKPVWNSGGTDFSPIEQFIKLEAMPENDGKYPKAVVVVTDGHADFYGRNKPSSEHAKNWFWLLLDNWQRDNAVQYLSKWGFQKNNFDTLDGYVDGRVKWS